VLVLLFKLTDAASLEWIEEVMARVPLHLPTLVVGTHGDLATGALSPSGASDPVADLVGKQADRLMDRYFPGGDAPYQQFSINQPADVSMDILQWLAMAAPAPWLDNPETVEKRSHDKWARALDVGLGVAVAGSALAAGVVVYLAYSGKLRGGAGKSIAAALGALVPGLARKDVGSTD
jgi:hypothetical protein